MSQDQAIKVKELEIENKRLKLELEDLRNNSGTDTTWYQNIIDSLPNPLFIKNEKHQWISMNNAFCEILGETKSDLIGKSDFDFFEKEEAQIFWDKDSEVLKNNSTIWNEEELTIDGNLKKVLTAKVRIEDRNGDYYVLGIITDMTDSKNYQTLLQHKNAEIIGQKRNIETLLKEVHHRVKNNLQIISSMLNLEMNQLKSEQLQTGFRNSQNRIISMSKVHEILYRSNNFSEVNINFYLTDLIKSISDSHFGDQRATLEVDVENILINPETATILGLIINEIITNSFKHFEGKESELQIYVRLFEENKFCCIEIGDNGPGNDVDENLEKQSVGLELIQLFAEQLQANFQRIDRVEGTHYLISFDHN